MKQKRQGYDYFVAKDIENFRKKLENSNMEEMTISSRKELLEIFHALTEEHYDNIYNFFHNHYYGEHRVEAKENYNSFLEAIGDINEAFKLGRVKSYGLYFEKIFEKVSSGEIQEVKGLREIINFLENLIEWVR